MIKKNKVYGFKILFFIFFLSIVVGYTNSNDKKGAENLSMPENSSQTYGKVENVLIDKEIERKKNEAWVNEHVNKDFLLGKVIRKDNPLFVKIDEEHTERNIYLLHAVYEAYKKMYEAALADSVKLVITSGHRLFHEQVYEWELRWDNPKIDSIFPNEIEKARYILQYRSMPGTSRHHWGTDIDLNSFELAYFQTKEGQKVYNWLKENAAIYGFFQPYTPMDEKRPVGYQEEKWHWSYKPLAQLIHAKYDESVSINDIIGFKGDVAAKELPIIAEWVNGINPQLLPLSGPVFSNINRYEKDHISATNSLRLIFAGDVMGHSTQNTGAWRDGGDSCYNFTPTFQWVKDYISSADFAIANFEVTLAGRPYTGYPAFSSPDSLAVALQDAGFDILLTANNHILDRGAIGLERTIDVLNNLGIKHTGTFKNLNEWQNNHPLIIEKNGFRLALLNYTYGTNSTTAKPPDIVNYVDTLKMIADLSKARVMRADYIIACIHWGEEYRNSENQAQRQIADFLARHGCKLVVGAHPHVVQPVNKIAGTTADSVLVAYSLGNFVSNQRWRYSDGGIMLEVKLTKTGNIVTLGSYRYEPFWVHRYPDNNVQVYRLIPIIDYLSNTECYPVMSAEDEKNLMRFYKDTKEIIPVIH